MFAVTPAAGGGRSVSWRLVAASVAALGASMLLAGAASAATGPVGQQLNVSPTTVAPGGTVSITGLAPSCTSVTLLSTVFPGPQEFAGVPAVTATSTASGSFSATVVIPATTHPGSYDISARACGGNLGISVTLVVATSIHAPNTGADLGAGRLGGTLALLATGALLLLMARRHRRA